MLVLRSEIVLSYCCQGLDLEEESCSFLSEMQCIIYIYLVNCTGYLIFIVNIY